MTSAFFAPTEAPSIPGWVNQTLEVHYLHGLMWHWLEKLANSVVVDAEVATAVGISLALVLWGNLIVYWSRSAARKRGKSAAETFTLKAQIAATLLILTVALSTGFNAGTLGFGAPTLDRPHPVVLGLLVLVACEVITFAAIGLRRHKGDSAWKVEFTRLIAATAGGEEFLFRGFLLTLWAATGASAAVMVGANVLAFGLWHAVGAKKKTRFAWLEVLAPGVAAVVFVAARLAFDSLLFPWLLHAAINLPGLALDLKRAGVTT